MLQFNTCIGTVALKYRTNLISFELGVLVAGVDELHLELLKAREWIATRHFGLGALSTESNSNGAFFFFSITMFLFIVIVFMPVFMAATWNAIIGLIFVVGNAQAPLFANPTHTNGSTSVFQEAIFQRSIITGFIAMLFLPFMLTLVVAFFLMLILILWVKCCSSRNVIIVGTTVEPIQMQRKVPLPQV